MTGTFEFHGRCSTDPARFSRLCAGLHRLSPRQLSELEARLAGLGARTETLAALDRRAAAAAVPRLRADLLGPATGSPFAGLRRPEALREVLRDMVSAVRPAPCRRLAERLGIDKTTVWRWRLRILAALERAAEPLSGVVEADQTTRRDSRKGSREWVRHARDPRAFPEPPRPTWREWRRRGVPCLWARAAGGCRCRR